jgi:hypothetical protein
MTKQTFYRNLAKCNFNDGGKWCLYPGPKSARVRYRSDAGHFCPITAVTYQKTGTLYKVDCYAVAAEKLGLSKKDAKCVQKAADNCKWNHMFSEFGVSKQALRASRLAILRAIGGMPRD